MSVLIKDMTVGKFIDLIRTSIGWENIEIFTRDVCPTTSKDSNDILFFGHRVESFPDTLRYATTYKTAYPQMDYNTSPCSPTVWWLAPLAEETIPEINKVIINPPATIVIWKDGKKTICKTHKDKYDSEVGLAMCIAKRYFGSRSKMKKVVKETEKRLGLERAVADDMENV